MPRLCDVPLKVTLSPLRLVPDFRDYWGDAHSKLVELTDPIVNAGCYIPRVYHAPDTVSEQAGVAANDYLEYILALPPGSFILAYLHTTAGVVGANNDPPAGSGFSVQITDVARNFKFFQRPVPETFFLNNAPAPNNVGPFAGGLMADAAPSPRLLTAPYPVAAPGEFKFQFWNQLDALNKLIQLSLLVAVPETELMK
jgi:hypothetical protein